MPSYTLLSIPAMWLTALAPHAWSMPYVKRHTPDGRFDNANFKTSAFAAKLAADVPADVLATYERAQAAHRNGLENLPLFAVGVMAATCRVPFSFSFPCRVFTFILNRNGEREKERRKEEQGERKKKRRRAIYFLLSLLERDEPGKVVQFELIH